MIDYAPDKITFKYIEEVCEDLKDKLDRLHDKGREEDYDAASMLIGHIDRMIDEMLPEDE